MLIPMRHQRTMSHMNTSCGIVSFCIAQKKNKFAQELWAVCGTLCRWWRISFFDLPKKNLLPRWRGRRVFFQKKTFAAQDREILLFIRPQKKTGPLEGLGVFAAQDVEAGESLFEIPQSCCIYPELVFADRQLGLFFFIPRRREPFFFKKSKSTLW